MKPNHSTETRNGNDARNGTRPEREARTRREARVERRPKKRPVRRPDPNSATPVRVVADLSAMHTPSPQIGEVDDLLGVGPETNLRRRERFSAARHAFTSPVFLLPMALVVALVVLSFLAPEGFTQVSSSLRDLISTQFGWFYLFLVAAVVVLCLYFMISPAGIITLGDPGEQPRFSRVSWIAMLFSAGMGIGLVFWGAAEPLSHFAISAPGGSEYSVEALREAFQYSFFHWGFSAWAVYGIVALAFAYFRFRKKERALISVTLKPLLGDRATGPIGKLVDSITVFATIVGVGTSLGFGSMQINGGLNYLAGVPISGEVQVMIIAVATVLFLASAASGLTRGVRMLSNMNVVLAIFLVAAAMVIGPTAQIMNVLVTALGDYLSNFVSMSFDIAPFDTTHHEWIEGWTIFYWAWWISWSPFVGVFIARISRGRSIREFLVCVLLVPTTFSCIWFAVFGTLSTSVAMGGTEIAALPTEVVLFATLSEFPLGQILSVVALVLIGSFFVTSADSATFVLGMISEGGNMTPHWATKIVWGLLLSALAVVLLTHGGLDALQNVLIISALPFSVVIIVMAVSLVKELRHEQLMMGLFVSPSVVPENDKPFRSYEEDERMTVQSAVLSGEIPRVDGTAVTGGSGVLSEVPPE